MAEQDYSSRIYEKQLWQEHLTMPNRRELDCPVYKTYTVPLKEAGMGRKLEEMWEQYRSRRAVGTKKVIEIENFGILESKAAFASRTTRKSQMAKLNRLVDLGLKVAESDLDAKRNKLKALVLKEETDITYEYVDRAQKLSEQMLEQRKKKVDEIIRYQELEKEEQARICREQQIRNNSEEYRNNISKMLKLESAEVQKHQICEKMMKKEHEEQLEKFWLDVAMKQEEEKRIYEEQEAATRITKIQEQRNMLNKQIIAKKMMEEEMKRIKKVENDFIDRLRERMKEEDEKEKEFSEKQKLELKKMKLAQMEEHQKLKMEMAAREKAFDDYYMEKVKECIELDKLNNLDDRAERKREADYFKQQLKEINAAKLVEENRIEALRLQEVAKKEAVIINNQEIMKEAKDKLHRETLETWKQQVINKKQALEHEKEIENLSNQWSKLMWEKNVELDKMFEDSQKVKEIDITKDLDAQIKFKKHLDERIRKQSDELLKKQQEEQKFMAERWKEFKPCVGFIHPFTKKLMEN